ncbi:MAG: hypothetical protein GY708_28640 [Actinomycetia bacterium]|nr:hypothetical protein [Actinomycetes bacterium]MCP5031613.1 hypothetical protein [Actinomycetes bacterium]
MNRFILLYHGYEAPTPHRVAAWNTWLRRRAASVADVGSPFGPGQRITNDTVDEFSLASNPVSGFSIVVAEHIDAAEQLLEGCPIVDGITLYEALAPESGSNI